jgi:prepilin-type N-terminal cleavage/methylation domain-containing protein
MEMIKLMQIKKSKLLDSGFWILDSRSGFTLVELLVAITLFSVIVSVAVGGFAGMLRTQRQITSLLTADANVGFAIEQMAREIRTGSAFCPAGTSGASLCDCSQNDPTTLSCRAAAFTDAEGQSLVYKLQGGALMKSADGGSTYAPLTATNIVIPYFNVLLFGNTPGDHWNPRLTIQIGVASKDAALAGQALHLQTTVSARGIDCDAAGNC